MNARTLEFALVLFGLSGCMIGPKTGDVVSGQTVGRNLEISGYVSEPNIEVDVQVMDDPTLDPDPDTSWSTFARGRSTQSPTRRAGQVGYKWDLHGVPVPDAAHQNRWRQGGILRVRALAFTSHGRTVLDSFDSDVQSCAKQFQNDPQGFKQNCISPWTPVATVVSSSPTPADEAVKPPYLLAKGTISTSETASYYSSVGAPPTLDAFEKRFHFNVAGSDQAGALYYNRADLGIGREMHCVTVPGVEGNGKACYVKNYGVDQNGKPAFGTNPNGALEDAVFRRNAFATVAMWIQPGGFGSRGVQFVVYDKNGNQQDFAQLDSTGQNTSIPNNCLACHGGTFNAAQKIAVGAHFLPFDPQSFEFSNRPQFRFQDQASSIRKLNAHIRQVNQGSDAAGQNIVDLIDGWYAPKGVTDPSATFNSNFVPAGWASSREGKKSYEQVYKPYCRTCHLTNPAFFPTFASFYQQRDIILRMACEEHTMPHAEATMKKFWSGPARGYLFAEMALGGSGYIGRNGAQLRATCAPEPPASLPSIP